MKWNTLILTMSFSMLCAISCSDPSDKNEETTSIDTENHEPTPEAITAPTLDDLQSDPDVIWLGEVMVDYALNYDRWSFDVTAKERTLMEQIGFKNRNGFKILKYQAADFNTSSNEDHLMINKILANRTKITFYRSSDINNTYLPEEIAEKIRSVDTIITFDPETKEEEMNVVVNDLNPDAVKAFRMKQLIYYSKKDICFKTITLAVAPLYLLRSEPGEEKKELEELFWMKPTALMTVPDLNNSAITWAKRTYRNFDLSTVKVLKQEYAIDAIIDSMMVAIRKNAETIKLGYTITGDGTEYLEKEEVKYLGAMIDTIVTFDSTAMQQVVKIEETRLDAKTIEGLRLLQDWVWNEETQSLSIRYVGFALLISRYNDKNEFLNSGPMFIRKVEDI